MRALSAAVVLMLLACSLSAQHGAQTMREHITASGCTVTQIANGKATDGELAPGDCIASSNGAFEDFYEFDGAAGQIADLRVYPLDPTMTNPIAFFLPPHGDASDTPVAIGGRGIWTAYVLASTGKWSVVVSSSDLFARGRYKIIVQTGADDDPGLPQSCIVQEIVCGQTLAWSLSSQSCRFGNDTNRLYGPFEFYAAAGDVLTFRQTSSAFNPLFGVYDKTNKLLASSTRTGQTATYFFSPPAAGLYYVDATSEADLSVGGYALSMDCSSGASGCIPPIITTEPADQQVLSGQNARVTVAVASVGAVKYSWYDSTGFPTFFTETTTGSLAIPNVSKATFVYVVATNACGQVTSRIARITPMVKTRAVRH